ncbi:MAG: hypothetical protein DVB26_05500 [Verrucomicrobia bacterium]|nr:MAG: hypothetical protein DVB26_05500 [Verrucomicrobiota bacterium]
MRLLCFCLLILCSVISHGQDARKVSCRFVYLGGTGPPPPLLNVLDKGTEVTCSIPTHTFSEPVVCCAKGNVISLVSSDQRRPMAAARIPESVTAAILVLMPAEQPAAPAPWRVLVIEDSVKNFPDGGGFVVNLYSQDIRCTIGEKTLILKAGSDHGFARPTTRDAFNMAPVIFQFQQNDSWRTASETLLRFVPGMRSLMFADLNPVSARLSITTFQDFMPVAGMPPLKSSPAPAHPAIPPTAPLR